MVTDLVFHRDGRPIVDFRTQWATACIAAGLRVTAADGTKRATALFHDFRRSCVRNLENASTPRKVAKSITGHITDSVYERYHVVKDEDQRAALARVEAAFPPKSRPAAPATALDVGEYRRRGIEVALSPVPPGQGVSLTPGGSHPQRKGPRNFRAGSKNALPVADGSG